MVKLTEEPTMPASRGVKRPIPADKITKWIIDNKVLSIALGGVYMYFIVCACLCVCKFMYTLTDKQHTTCTHMLVTHVYA